MSQGSRPREGRREVPLCPFQHAPWPPAGLDWPCALVTRSLCCSSHSHSLAMYLEVEMAL